MPALQQSSKELDLLKQFNADLDQDIAAIEDFYHDPDLDAELSALAAEELDEDIAEFGIPSNVDLLDLV